MKQVTSTIIILCMLMTSCEPLYAIVAGSENSVSIQSHTLFPQADADNEMRGFGWFKNGFTLENSATTCIFNSVYPVSGLIRMQGGTVILNKDLVFEGIIPIHSLGTIYANGFFVDFSTAKPLAFAVSDIPTIYHDVNLVVTQLVDFTVTHTLEFHGNSTIIGNNASFLNIGPQGEVLCGPNSTLTLRNLTLTGLQDHNFRCVDDTGKIIFQDCILQQSGDYHFSTGSFGISKTNEFITTFSFIYDSVQSSTIQANSLLRFSQGTFQIGRANDATSTEPLVFTDRTSVLNMQNSTLRVNEHGMQLLKGTVEFTGTIILDYI